MACLLRAGAALAAPTRLRPPFPRVQNAGTTVDALVALNPDLQANNGQSLQPGEGGVGWGAVCAAVAVVGVAGVSVVMVATDAGCARTRHKPPTYCMLQGESVLAWSEGLRRRGLPAQRLCCASQSGQAPKRRDGTEPPASPLPCRHGADPVPQLPHLSGDKDCQWQRINCPPGTGCAAVQARCLPSQDRDVLRHSTCLRARPLQRAGGCASHDSCHVCSVIPSLS